MPPRISREMLEPRSVMWKNRSSPEIWPDEEEDADEDLVGVRELTAAFFQNITR